MKKNKTHPVIDFAEKLRKTFLTFGFEEIINSSIIEEKDVYKQYGAEAPIILDRCFYLAGLTRPELGISKESRKEIDKIAEINIGKLQEIFREYKEGKIEADDLVEKLVKELNIKTEKALKILAIFPEFKKLKPVPGVFLLRSHMTGAWFPTISSLIKKRVLPLKLFSIGGKFRREQEQDPFHLYESLSASLAIVDKKFDLEEGKKLTKKILSKLGFKETVFKMKLATSNYYAPGTEFEIFIIREKEEIEVGDGGLYSTMSLKNYNISYPVFNVGFGVERMAMLKEDIQDIRQLVYPQFYVPAFFSDKEIAENISLSEQPKTKWGKNLVKEVVKMILKYKDEIGPQKILIFKGKGIKMFLTEPEAGKKLLGPAGLNVVYVFNQEIFGISEKDERVKEIIKKGVKTYSFPEAIANLFVSLAENKSFGRHTIRMADSLPSINLKLEEVAENFITGQNKKINIGGPIFIDVEIEKE